MKGGLFIAMGSNDARNLNLRSFLITYASLPKRPQLEFLATDHRLC
jgi:hypothetical protein